MSYRREDQGLVEYIQSLEARIKRLEGGDKGVRQNDIRLGNMVVTTNVETNQICIENLDTGETQCFGAASDEVIFSHPDEVEDDGERSGPYPVKTSCIARTITVAARVAPSSAVTVTMYFGTATHEIVLGAGQTVNTITVEQGCAAGMHIIAEITEAGSGAEDLTVTVRFG